MDRPPLRSPSRRLLRPDPAPPSSHRLAVTTLARPCPGPAALAFDRQPARAPRLALWLALALAWLAPALPARASEPPRDPWLASLGDGPRQRIEALAAAGWPEREAATSWLIAHPEAWASALPVGWRPRDPEAAWRWQQILTGVHDLASFPTDLGVLPWEQLVDRARTLARRQPEAFRGALAEALEAAEARVRQRAIELIAELPGVAGRPLLTPLEPDPSPWVRRSLYRLALAEDPDWARELLAVDLARAEPSALALETVRAARWLPGSDLLPLLRARWEGADLDLRSELALSLALYGRPEDHEVFRWLARIGEPELALAGVRALVRNPRPADAGILLELLERDSDALRRAALEALPCPVAADLRPCLERLRGSPHPEVARFARTALGAGADVALGSGVMATTVESSPAGTARAVRALAHEDEGALPVPALEPAPERREKGN